MAYENAAAFFSAVKERIDADEDVREELEDIGASYLFKLQGDGGGLWTVDLEEMVIEEGEMDAPDCVVDMKASDFMGVVNGELNSQELFMAGELMIEGDMSLALKLEKILTAA